MESEARYTLVGSILLVLVVAVMAVTVWLAHTGRRGFEHYVIYFERHSLEGLQVGGDVNVRGVKVGRVDDFRIERDNINRVRVTVRINPSTPVSNNTVAVVARNLVTGLARVNLVTPDPPGPELTLIPPGEDFPVIGEGQSDLDQLADAVNHIALSGGEALENINRVLSAENQKALSDLLVNVNALAQSLNGGLGRVDKTLAGFDRSAAEIARAGRQVAQAADRISRDVTPLTAQAEVALRDLSSAVRTMERDIAR
ncbi:MAG: MCE family protein, partial [Burkholderiales bacterium]|nr:MCE family protein [Burkholderiales bacterium]